MSNLVLASSSPRRKELLERLSIPFTIFSPDVDETVNEELLPSDLVITLALRKARKVAESQSHSCIIGSDTVVVNQGKVLGKPVDRESAKQMLLNLSGTTHTVYTGVAVIFNDTINTFYEKTDVTFWNLSDEEIEQYLDSGEPFDKAGAYGIQGQGSLLVKSIHGDYYSVVGLPIGRLSRELRNMGFSL